jgi:hypothetical protein
MLLVAIIVSPCVSQYVESHPLNTTLVYSCPKTVRYIWEEYPEGPQDHARRLHYWGLPRDDRPPLQSVAQEPPKAEPVKKVKKKANRKKKKRRG